MQQRKSKASTLKVIDRNTGKVVGYLTKTMEEKGLDILYNILGYDIVVID